MQAARKRCLTAALLLLTTSPATAADAPDTLVICAAEFQPALVRWIAHRSEQGHRVLVVEPEPTAAGLERQVQEAAQGRNLQFVLLVGDAPARYAPAGTPTGTVLVEQTSGRGETQPQWAVPAVLVPAKVNVHWGSEPEIATDSPYADLDDDGLPDVAIGRLPVRSPAELRTVLDKIIRYENSAGHEPWRRQVNIVAGLGGFGRTADAALEATTRALLTQGIPAGYHTHLTYASWQSAYCPPPQYFREYTIGGFNAGCLFWVYLGHGMHTLLDHIYVPGGSYPILDRADVGRLRPASGSPIALLVACHSGAFDGGEDSLAEAMLTAPDGPVAVIAGSRMTLPYGNAVFCSELMQECFTSRRPTLGELLLHAKRNCNSQRSDDARRGALDLLASLLSPLPGNLAAERREHTLLYNLLGDPLLRIAHAGEVTLDVSETVTAGRALTVRGVSTISGDCTLELVTERGRLPFPQPKRDAFEQTDAAVAEYADTYRRANERRHAACSLPVQPGAFAAELDVPEAARGTCYVRAFIAGETEHALGAAKVTVLPRNKPPQTQSARGVGPTTGR